MLGLAITATTPQLSRELTPHPSLELGPPPAWHLAHEALPVYAPHRGPSAIPAPAPQLKLQAAQTTPMFRPRYPSFIVLAGCLAAAINASAQQPDPDAAAVQAVVRSFHDALRRGDTQAAQALLAADAVILEGGHIESREEYLKHHLGADIEFAKAVPSTVTHSEATVSGQTAWVRSATSSRGQFRNRKVKFSGAELVVLTRRSAGWEIRAVHWSSHELK